MKRMVLTASHPISVPASFTKVMVLVLCALAYLTPVAKANTLETQKVNGKTYYTVRSLKKFYYFTTAKRSGNRYILENKDTRVEMTIGGQTCLMNGVKFIFSFPVIRSGNRFLVSQIDVVKLMDPVLRPAYIPSAASFRTVILDPGHGGVKSGAQSRYGVEKHYTLRVCKMIKKLLEGAGYRVVMTRENDRDMSLSERVQFANRFENAIFISMHFNSGGGATANGIETFTLSPQGVAHYGRRLKNADFNARTGNRQDSANIALATAVHHKVVKSTRGADRGIKRARFNVLSGVRHPAILLEGGFLDHPVESKRIHSTGYQKSLAHSVASAVRYYHIAITRARN